MSSQIGYVIILANKQKKDLGNIIVQGNILHQSSTKYKRVTRSVLASELYVIVVGFDIGSVIQTTSSGILSTEIPLVICTDSYSLYDYMTKLGSIVEKRLMIDIIGLRQSYERREINKVRQINRSCNLVDVMTKEKLGQALQRLVETNTIELITKAQVERK